MGVFWSSAGRVRLGWRILLFLGLAVALVALTSLIPFRGLPWETLPVLLGSLGAGWMLLALDHRSPGALGFHLDPEAVTETVAGLGLGVGVAALVLAILFTFGALRWTADEGGFLAWLSVGGSSLLLFSLPAAAEEALMRGYLFQALGEAWGGPVALLVTSVIFAMLHLGNPNVNALGLANILAAGLFLGVIYLKTASLWWATAAHMGWNWAHGFLGDLPVSGLELVDAPLMEPVLSGPAWISGGAFGPEASVVATAVLGAVTLVLWKSSFLAPGEGMRKREPLILSRPGRGAGPGGGQATSTTGEPWSEK